MNVLFVTGESSPFITTGGLGEVAGSLPFALNGKDTSVRVVMPLYGDIKDEYKRKMKFTESFNVPLGWRNQYCGIFHYKYNGVTYYFLDNEYYFKRNGIYGFYDDAERFAFFCRAVLEMLPCISFKVDLFHVNDWQASLVPTFLNCFYKEQREYENIRSLLTIHNIAYQGEFDSYVAKDILGIGDGYLNTVEYGGKVNFLKSAIITCTRVNTVSPTYAEELSDPWFAHRLDPLLRENKDKLSGILNGIDTVSYDPETDSSIPFNYSIDDYTNKALCKKELQKELDLTDGDMPVIGMVSRLVAHKGLDLVSHILEEILTAGMKVVILGSGELLYEETFKSFEQRYPHNFVLRLGFIPDLARRIYAGSDMFLMPSKSEPCGLAQMIALRYGSIPIVRETGGLKDTVTDCGDGKGNGFTFKSYNAHDLLDACMRAKDMYENRELWQNLITRAMRCDFSWNRAAKDYRSLYMECLK